MSTIEILPNTFYVKQPFERDGFLSATYTDRTLRDGIVSGSIENKLNSDRYIFNVKTPQTPKFGAYGVPQQQYLFLNTQELVINDNYATPVYKVYRRRNSFTLTTGSYSDADSDLAIYTTQVNYNGSIMTETFDGINKGFGQDVETQPQFVISQESEDNGQYILYSDVKALAKKKKLDIRLLESPTWGGNVKIQSPNFTTGGVGPATAKSLAAAGVSEEWYAEKHLRERSGGGPLAHSAIKDRFLLKSVPGKYNYGKAQGITYAIQLFKNSRFGGKWNVSSEYLQGSVSELNSRGLTVHTDRRIVSSERNVIEETATNAANQYNTLFNVMRISPNFNDVKTQTLESTGDDTNPYAYSMAYFSSDDKVTGPQSLVLDHFWENYSGTASTAGQMNKLNFTGVYDFAAKLQYPQELTMGVANIPEIIPLEFGSGSTATTSSVPEGPTTTGEIEIVFKIKALPSCVTGNTGVTNVKAVNLLRSHNFIFSSAPIQAEERFWDYIYRANNGPTLTGGANMMGVGAVCSGSFLRLYDMGGHFGQFVDLTEYVANGTGTRVLQDDNFPAATAGVGVDVNFDEWIRMRVKIDPKRANQLAYFPDIKDSNGGMAYLYLTTSLGLVASGAQAFSSLVINNSNFRSINAGSTSGSNPQYGLTVDEVVNADQRSTLLIDEISFNNFNLDIKNCSDLPSNEESRQIHIPAPPMTVPKGRTASDAETSLSANDNYFMSATCPTATTINIGFEDIDFLPASIDTTGSALQLLMHGYDSINPVSNLINDNYFRFGYSKNGGGSGDKAGIIYGTGPLTASGGRGAVSLRGQTYPQFSVANFTNSMNGAGQKGLLDFCVSGGTSASTTNKYISSETWTRRENEYVQARILQVHPNGYKIQVDNAEILKLNLGDNKSKYVIYRLGAPWDTTNKWPSAGFHKGYISSEPLYITDIDEEGWVHLNETIPVTYHNDIHRYAISPFRYWINIAIFNAKYSTGGNVDGKWGEWYKNTSPTTYTLNGGRSYTSLSCISGSGVFGTTFNETVFTDARTYLNQQKLSIGENTDIECQMDFGWGAYQPADETTTEVPSGYIAKAMPQTNSYEFLDMTAEIRQLNLPRNVESTYLIMPWDEDDDSSYKITIDTALSSRNAGLYRPHMVYGYTDALPICGDLQVSPSVDLLRPNADYDKLTKSTATDVVLNWRENADDVWYRLLYVDNTLIDNKYHKVNFYAPLNEAGPYLGSAITAKYYTKYEDYPNGGTAFASGSYRPVIDGYAGWGHYISGNSSLNWANSQALHASDSNLTIGSSDEYTFVMHCTPNFPSSAGGGGDAETYRLFSVSSSAAMDNCFQVRALVEYDGVAQIYSNYIQVTMAQDGSSNSTLKSVTQYAFDGVEPLAIVVTYNKNRSSNNFRLYINGKLEDTNDYTGTFPATGKVMIGAGYSAGGMITQCQGNYEEIFFSSKEAYVPQRDGEFTLVTKDLADTTSNVSNNWQAKLFIMDYHNIRGATYRQVAETNSTAWKVTGVS